MNTKVFSEKSWKYQTSGIGGNVILFGVNIFDYQWIETGKIVPAKVCISYLQSSH